ncbi:surface protease GP63 [Trypanosoma theileri]|uniref:Leishmanolysin-like peptidase n=1 Tax=Trypanosoma theileri TaxID=67003 RepID=A0A1X0P3B3_9TRYP|nr:surface protease GP63 [Trypanosoma theileri]ORC91039.1 surface protease GP63 [Trypanosoma theileri]
MRFFLVLTTFVLLLLFQCVRSSLAVTEYHHCIHDKISGFYEDPKSRKEVSHEVKVIETESGNQELPQRSAPNKEWNPIRIEVFTHDLEKQGRYCAKKGEEVKIDVFNSKHTCTEEDVLTPEKKNILVNTILKEAVKLHSDRLRVERLKGPLVVPKFGVGTKCATFTVPDKHHTDGVPDVDMVLYVSARPSKYSGSFAWALTCATLGNETARGRSVVGVMNYAPKYILATAQRVRVAAHEIAHVLGFSVSEMDRLKMIKDLGEVRGREKLYVVSSPNTLRETRSHYNCNTTKGMLLEDQTLSVTKVIDGQRDASHPRLPPNSLIAPHLGGPGSPLHGSLISSSPLRDSLDDPLPRLLQPHEKPPTMEGGETLHTTQLGQSLNSRRDTTIQENTRNTVEPNDADIMNQLKKEGKIIGVERHHYVDNLFKHRSHWKRHNAKDELMAGVVGAGYYTALTMAFFADMGYYKVEWSKAEPMSWGNQSGCKLLDDKCVNNGKTEYTEMFCTTEHTDKTLLQCTSDRHALGTCLLQELKHTPYYRGTTSPYLYFEKGHWGSPEGELMDYCPFITANNDNWCTDGIADKMPGSVIAPNSRCVKGVGLKVNEKNIGDVCVNVSCKYNVVSVKYKGNEKWHLCAEGTKLEVNTNELKGQIVCPKYADVCNTINVTLDELEGPPPPPEPGIQSNTPGAKSPTGAEGQGTAVGTGTTTTNTGTTTPTNQNPGTPNSNANSATATGNTAAIDNNVTIQISHTDGVAAPAAALFGTFVCLLLITTMVAVS